MPVKHPLTHFRRLFPGADEVSLNLVDAIWTTRPEDAQISRSEFFPSAYPAW